MKLTINNEVCEAVRFRVVSSEEVTSSYLLDDGTVVKVRCLLTGIWKLTGKQDVNGNPAYHLNWHVVPTTEPGD